MKAEIPGLDAALARDIYAHCFGTTDREVGGVLIGTITPGSPPTIEASIRAAQATEAAAQLTFTQDTWEHIHRELEANYPGLQIIGWYHSHPGYGLFLSEQDLFIHQNFFQNRSQIALVLDPLAGEEAVYAWFRDGIKEYLRRKSAYQGVAAPRARGADAAVPPPQLSTLQASRIEPRRGAPVDVVPITTWIYLLVIGLSAGIVFWELFLK